METFRVETVTEEGPVFQHDCERENCCNYVGTYRALKANGGRDIVVDFYKRNDGGYIMRASDEESDYESCHNLKYFHPSVGSWSSQIMLHLAAIGVVRELPHHPSFWQFEYC